MIPLLTFEQRHIHKSWIWSIEYGPIFRKLSPEKMVCSNCTKKQAKKA